MERKGHELVSDNADDRLYSFVPSQLVFCFCLGKTSILLDGSFCQFLCLLGALRSTETTVNTIWLPSAHNQAYLC